MKNKQVFINATQRMVMSMADTSLRHYIESRTVFLEQLKDNLEKAKIMVDLLNEEAKRRGIVL